MSKHPNEKVLVITRELFDELGAFQGFTPNSSRYLRAIFAPENNQFLDRDHAEEDPQFKQIIPYAVFRCGDKYLHYVRGAGAGERRLASKGSLGIGGHVNEEDFQATGSLGRSLYEKGVEREIAEELTISTGYTQEIVGLINDDSNAVGQVHLGVVHLFELDASKVTSNESGITNLEFLTTDAIEKRANRLETWSQLIVQNFNWFAAMGEAMM